MDNNQEPAVARIIAYVPESFPQISETFVINEIKGMIDFGFHVDVLPRIDGVESVEHENYLYIKDKINILKQDVIPNFKSILLAFHRGSQRLSYKQFIKPNILYSHICKAIDIAKHAKRIIQSKPDIILVHFGYDNATAGAIASKLLGCPMMLCLHGSDVHSVPHRSIKWITCRASIIIASSNYMRNAILELGVTRKIIVSNSGVGKEFFVNNTRAREPLLITVARLGHCKNHHRTLRVLKIVKQTIPNIKLLIVGDGPDRDALEKYAHDLRLKNNVEFLGNITQEKIRTLLNKSWVKLLFSEKEGLGVSLIEAQACGIPCVASEIGGIPEVVLHGETGYLVDFSDINGEEYAAQYIISLIQDVELLNDMSRIAHLRAKNIFSEQRHYDFMAKTINDLIEGNKCPHQ